MMLSDEDSLTHRKHIVYIPNLSGLSIVYVCNYNKETLPTPTTPTETCLQRQKNHKKPREHPE